MLVVTESEKHPGLRYLASRDESGKLSPASASDFDELLRAQGIEPTPPPEQVLPPARYDPQAPSITRRQLTEGEAAELASRYDPASMTQEEYDSLLEELVEKGVLSQNELGPMGYHGWIIVGSLAEGGTGLGGGACAIDTATLHSNPHYQRYGLALSLSDTEGNALAYAKLMALLTPASGTAGWMDFAKKRHSSFQALADVLEAMQSKRGE